MQINNTLSPPSNLGMCFLLFQQHTLTSKFRHVIFAFFEKATQAPTKDQPKGPKLVRNRGCNPETGLTKGNSKAQTGNQSSTARALERKNTEIPAG
jgi:hypothetical protein